MVNQNFRLKMRALLFSVLALGLALAGCDSGLQSNAEAGTLEVTNCPDPVSGSAYIVDANMPTRKWAGPVIGTSIAIGTPTPESDTSYTLRETTYATFTGSGNFLVLLFINQNWYLKNVPFSSGFGTVDFNSMTAYASLPE